MRGPCLVIGALALLFASASLATAAPSRVVVLRSVAADPLTKQAETLLGAELRTAGFEVTEVERKPGADVRAEIESTSTRLRPIATLAILHALESPAAEVWLSDRVTGKLVIRRVDTFAGSGSAAGDLALQAVELLRGSLLEITVETPGPKKDEGRPPADVARFVQKAEAGRSPHALTGIGVGVGAAALTGTGALGTSYGPMLRVSYGLPRGLVIRATFVGPASAQNLELKEGTATVHQLMGELEVMQLFRPRALLQPFVLGAAGFHHVSVDGTGSSSLFASLGGSTTSFMAAAGGGIVLRLGKNALVAAEAQAGAIAPATSIEIAGQEVARLQTPRILLNLTFASSF